jgi:DNA-binding PadR family transcriptional regulator
MAPPVRPPLREPSYFVLAALQTGPRHGYAIIQAVLELTSGRLKLAVGTLYSVLDRLSGEGYIEVTGEEIVNGRARRYYALTGSGLTALIEEADRMAQAASVVARPTRTTTMNLGYST